MAIVDLIRKYGNRWIVKNKDKAIIELAVNGGGGSSDKKNIVCYIISNNGGSIATEVNSEYIREFEKDNPNIEIFDIEISSIILYSANNIIYGRLSRVNLDNIIALESASMYNVVLSFVGLDVSSMLEDHSAYVKISTYYDYVNENIVIEIYGYRIEGGK